MRTGAWRRAIARVLGLSTAALAAACASGPPTHTSTPRALAITDVAVVDVVAGRILPGMTVVTRGDRIVSVTAGGPAPRDARRLDGRGRFLIPGLWDMHAHHQGSGEESLPLFLANGVVGTRDMGSDAAFIFPLRERVRAGAVRGPRIVAAGPILDDAAAGWPWRRKVTGASDAAAAVAALKREGADFVKVHDATPRDAYFAVVEEAKRQGLPVAGHVPNAVKVEEAARAGQASIEHLANFRVFGECAGQQPYSAARCAELFDLLARNGVWQTPTAAFFQNIPDLMSGVPPPAVEYASPSLRRLWRENEEASKLPEPAKQYLQMQARVALQAVPDMKTRGVRFLAGCDGLVPGFCLHDELEWMTRFGMSPAEALRTATINPAVFLGRQKAEGEIAPGKRADLVLLDADPLADIRNTRRIRAVVVGGELIERPELDAMLAQAKASFAAQR